MKLLSCRLVFIFLLLTSLGWAQERGGSEINKVKILKIDGSAS